MAKKILYRSVSLVEAQELLSDKACPYVLRAGELKYVPTLRSEILDLMVGHEIKYLPGGVPSGMDLSLWVRDRCVYYLDTGKKPHKVLGAAFEKLRSLVK